MILVQPHISNETRRALQIATSIERSTQNTTSWSVFLNRIKRFRRIALRCEKTGSSFKAFVDLAGAMAWMA